MTTTERSDSPSIEALFVEDDQKLAALTKRYLEKNGVVVTLVHSGTEAVAEATRRRFDVVLLDIMLPGMDGLAVCRELRSRSDVPIIMLTARDDEVDKVIGLETGADDYLPKPYSSRELLARIHAQVRRARGKAGPQVAGVLRVNRLVLDPGAMSVTLDGRAISLTAYELTLLRVLAERAGRVLSRDQLLDLAQNNADEVFDRSIDVHIWRLRQKLEDDPSKPQLIKTVRGAGYMLAIESEGT